MNCLFVKDVSFRVINSFKMVIIRVVSLRRGGIVMIGVFKGIMFEVIRRSAMMLF